MLVTFVPNAAGTVPLRGHILKHISSLVSGVSCTRPEDLRYDYLQYPAVELDRVQRYGGAAWDSSKLAGSAFSGCWAEKCFRRGSHLNLKPLSLKFLKPQLYDVDMVWECGRSIGVCLKGKSPAPMWIPFEQMEEGRSSNNI